MFGIVLPFACFKVDGFFLNYNVMFCAIWYHFYNLKNVENSHGGVLLLVKLQKAYNFTKSNTPPWMFFMFFKLYKCYQIAQSIAFVELFWKRFQNQNPRVNSKIDTDLKLLKPLFFSEKHQYMFNLIGPSDNIILFRDILKIMKTSRK